MQLFYALLVTLVIEAPVMFALSRSENWVFCNILCNLVTNPILNITLLLVLKYTGKSTIYTLCVVIGELLVLFSEMLLYRAMTGEGWGKCFTRSLITNGMSFGIGLLL